MKILKIAFQNINSLRGNHEIDFTKAPFTAGSLFAITGPTGSGKSTILDVISLALFNQVPRLGKITKKEILEKGALLTRNQREAYASVSYACAEGNFTSKWSIAINRNNNLNDYEMEICHSESGELVDCKKSEVPARNEDLIGLNYNQFIKSVVLAQGEFAQFLKAKKDERGELLEKITGTGIYRNLGIRAYDKFREVNREIKTRKDNILFLQEDLLPDDVKVQKKEELAEKEQAYQPKETEIKSLEKKIEQKSLIEKQRQELNEQEAKKAAQVKQLNAFTATYGNAISAHEKVQNQADNLRNWSRQSENLLELKTDISKLNQQRSDNSQQQSATLAEAGNFTHQELKADTIEVTLQDFSKKINGLLQQRAEKVKDYSTLKAQLQRELQNLNFKGIDKTSELDLTQLKHLKSFSEEELYQLQQSLQGIDLSDLPGEKNRLNENLEDIFKARQLADSLYHTENELNKLSLEEQEISKEVQNLPQQISPLKAKQETLKERLEKQQLEKENKELRASLEEHRARLNDGEPCPLCGAVHHPFASGHPVETSEIAAAIQQTSRELEVNQKTLSEAESKLKINEERLRKTIAEKDYVETEWQQLADSFTQQFKKFDSLKESNNWEESIQQIKNQMRQLDAYDSLSSQISALDNAIPLQKQLDHVVQEGKQLKVEITQLYSGDDIFKDTNRILQQWTMLSQEAKSLERQLKDLQEKYSKTTTTFSQLETSLIQAVQVAGFKIISEARKALLPDAEYNQLREQRESIQKMIAQHDNTISLLKEKLDILIAQDVPESIGQLKELLQEKKEASANLLKACEDLRRLLKNDADNLHKIESIRSEIAQQEKKTKRWRLLNELIGDATGKKFNDFAQDLSLSQLLVLANNRLKDLSDRYRIDKPADTEDDSLVAIDEHMGGQRRSVKTLSGGETFLLSLSLALALSDMASRNVEINSLFIDEGFGTLDPETLDQTLDTLEKLQAESSKTIGIISHVDSLKERIATQIQLKRHGQGYSTLEIK